MPPQPAAASTTIPIITVIVVEPSMSGHLSIRRTAVDVPIRWLSRLKLWTIQPSMIRLNFGFRIHWILMAVLVLVLRLLIVLLPRLLLKSAVLHSLQSRLVQQLHLHLLLLAELIIGLLERRLAVIHAAH